MVLCVPGAVRLAFLGALMRGATGFWTGRGRVWWLVCDVNGLLVALYLALRDCYGSFGSWVIVCLSEMEWVVKSRVHIHVVIGIWHQAARLRHLVATPFHGNNAVLLTSSFNGHNKHCR